MSKAKKNEPNKEIIAKNPKARYDYFITETFEAGIMLKGTEVKSLRDTKASLKESHAGEMDGGIWIFNLHILPYSKAGKHLNHKARRPRQLLLHKRQINKILGAIQAKGATIVPLSLYFNERGIAKLEIALAKGKKQHDKRQTSKNRDWNREKQRVLRDKG